MLCPPLAVCGLREPRCQRAVLTIPLHELGVKRVVAVCQEIEEAIDLGRRNKEQTSEEEEAVVSGGGGGGGGGGGDMFRPRRSSGQGFASALRGGSGRGWRGGGGGGGGGRGRGGYY